MAAVVAGGVAAVVVTLLVLNHRRQVRHPDQGPIDDAYSTCLLHENKMDLMVRHSPVRL